MAIETHPSSLIELLHPDGAPRTVRVIGSACPEGSTLCPRGRDTRAERADLVVIAPSREEGTRERWLAAAAQTASDLLDGDGIVYVLADRAWRAAVTKHLTICGLDIESVYLHHPGWPETELLIPATYDGISYAYSRLIHTDPLRRKAALAALAAPGALAATRWLLAQTGLVARRPGSRPSLSWLPGVVGRGGRTVVQASWRGATGAVLLHALNGSDTPAAIAKIWLADEGTDAFRRELAGLNLAVPQAGRAGARVPRLLGHGDLRGRPYLVEEAVPGEKAAEVFARDPGRIRGALARLADWLGGWNARTADPRALTAEDLDRYLLQPARRLREGLALGEEYEARLRDLGRRLIGQTVPFVAAHGDLTMVNVLLDEQGELGVIDWETASSSDLPLTDFFYALVDAIAATTGYDDRIAAWTACFSPSGAHREQAVALRDRLAGPLKLSPDAVALCFQATWLRHAVAERRETTKTAPDEFLRIAQRAAIALINAAPAGGAV